MAGKARNRGQDSTRARTGAAGSSPAAGSSTGSSGPGQPAAPSSPEQPEGPVTRAASVGSGQVGHRRARYLSAALVVGAAAAAAVVVAAGLSTAFGLLVGWDTAATVYLALLWARLWPLDGAALAARARVTDPTRVTTDLLLITAALASLVAVGFALATASDIRGWRELAQVGLGLVSVVVSWTVVHTVYAVRYAHLYYQPPVGGVLFPTTTATADAHGLGQDGDSGSGAAPGFSDFAYLGFTIGMTFQVSDTTLTSATMRRTALRHGLLSFLFGTGILATTINLVASLTSK